jgi:hypothetical protein
MRRENLSKHLYGLFIFIGVICLLPVFPLAANATTLASLHGAWHYTSFATGPSAPWWERGSLTVASDGTFTGSGSDINSITDTLSAGAFSFVPDGILMTASSSSGGSSSILFQIDANNNVLVGTQTWSDGSSVLVIGTKPASYSLGDGPGNWEGNYLMSFGPPYGFAATLNETITSGGKSSNGQYIGNFLKAPMSVDNGLAGWAPFTVSGQLYTSSAGVVTIHSCSATGTFFPGDNCMDPPYEGFMDPGYTVVVATEGSLSASPPNAVLSLFT